MSRHKRTAPAVYVDLADNADFDQPWHAAFAQNVLEGMNATDALKASKNTENSATSTIYVLASQTYNNPKVKAFIAAARRAGLAAAGWTQERMIRTLDAAAQDCLDAGNHGARIAAYGKIADILEMTGTSRPARLDAEPQEIVIKLIAELGPIAGAAIAQHYGVTLPKLIEHEETQSAAVSELSD